MLDDALRELERTVRKGDNSARPFLARAYARSGRRGDAVNQLIRISQEDNDYRISRKDLVTQLFYHAIDHFARTKEDYVFEGVKNRNTDTMLGLLANSSDPLWKQRFLFDLGFAYRTLEEYKNQGIDVDPDQTLQSFGIKPNRIKTANQFYLMCQESRSTSSKNNATNDWIDYGKGDPHIKKLDPTDRSVVWYVEPRLIAPAINQGEWWEHQGGQEVKLAIPKPGWPIWTYISHPMGGNEYLLYRPFPGTPVRVADTKQEAIQNFEGMGIPRTVADEAVSRFYSRKGRSSCC